MTNLARIYSIAVSALIIATNTQASDLEYNGKRYAITPRGETRVVVPLETQLNPPPGQSPRCGSERLFLIVRHAEIDELEWQGVVGEVSKRESVSPDNIIKDTEFSLNGSATIACNPGSSCSLKPSSELSAHGVALSSRVIFGERIPGFEVTQSGTICDLISGKARLMIQDAPEIRVQGFWRVGFRSDRAGKMIDRIAENMRPEWSPIERAAILGYRLRTELETEAGRFSESAARIMLKTGFDNEGRLLSLSERAHQLRLQFEDSFRMSATWSATFGGGTL